MYNSCLCWFFFFFLDLQLVLIAALERPRGVGGVRGGHDERLLCLTRQVNERQKAHVSKQSRFLDIDLASFSSMSQLADTHILAKQTANLCVSLVQNVSLGKSLCCSPYLGRPRRHVFVTPSWIRSGLF